MVDNKHAEYEPEKIEDFLAQQKLPEFEATLEEVKDNGTLVKITPWIQGGGCLCHAALEVEKSTIEQVTPTGDSHFCCGKMLRVGRIKFKKDARISLERVLANLMQSGPPGGRGGAQIPFSGHQH